MRSLAVQHNTSPKKIYEIILCHHICLCCQQIDILRRPNAGTTMSSLDILARDRTSESVSIYDSEYDIIACIIREAQRTTAELNTGYHEEEEV